LEGYYKAKGFSRQWHSIGEFHLATMDQEALRFKDHLSRDSQLVGFRYVGGEL
jgi:hypothetical protein